MTARAQSFDRFTVLTIWPLGMVNISPSVDRSLVTRSVTSSTVPSAGRVDAGDRERYQVAEAVLLLGDDEEPGEQVLHDALRAETECGAQHRGRRDERSRPGWPGSSVTCIITRTNSSATDTQEITDATAWRCLALSVRTSWSLS